jgi:hypothetical protein
MVEEWVKSIVGPSPLRVGGRYRHPIDGEIEIISGQFWGTHGVSNFWHWRIIATGETHHGYGDSWEEIT